MSISPELSRNSTAEMERESLGDSGPVNGLNGLNPLGGTANDSFFPGIEWE